MSCPPVYRIYPSFLWLLPYRLVHTISNRTTTGLWAEAPSYLQPEWHSQQIGNEAEIHTGQIIHSLKSHRAASYFKRSSTSDENVTARTGDMQHERWRILCQQAAKEQDLERLLQLVREMNRLVIKRLLQADVSIAGAGPTLRGRIARS